MGGSRHGDEMEERAQEAATTPRDPSVSTAVLVRQVQDLQRELGRMETRHRSLFFTLCINASPFSYSKDHNH